MNTTLRFLNTPSAMITQAERTEIEVLALPEGISSLNMSPKTIRKRKSNITILYRRVLMQSWMEKLRQLIPIPRRQIT